MTTAAFSAELHKILRWWQENTLDRQHGGFIGRMDAAGRTDPAAEKGLVLNARILWTFSAASRQLNDAGYRAMADRAFRYLLDHFWDESQGGFYWTVDYRGQPAQTKKQVYGQAFAIYALSEYYRLTQQSEAFEKAAETFALLESFCLDQIQNGYFEAFSRAWRPLGDLRLSEKEGNDPKTMNTHLHLLEAYATMVLLPSGEVVRPALINLIELFLTRFIDPESGHLNLFFDENWQSTSEKISFGHDIECSWLLLEAAERSGDAALIERARQTAIRMAEATLLQGRDGDGALFNEADSSGISDSEKDWWPQAEAVVGFLNAWQLSDDPRFYTAATESWNFIQNCLLDRQLGEWHWGVDRAGNPLPARDKVSLWKCPYHNGRACLEGMKRMLADKLPLRH